MRNFAANRSGTRVDEWQADSVLDPAAWVSLAELAVEGFGSAENLETRVRNLRRDLAGDILLDDIGRACVPRSVARRLFADRAECQHDAERHVREPVSQVRTLQARAALSARGLGGDR